MFSLGGSILFIIVLIILLIVIYNVSTFLLKKLFGNKNMKIRKNYPETANNHENIDKYDYSSDFNSDNEYHQFNINDIIVVKDINDFKKEIVLQIPQDKSFTIKTINYKKFLPKENCLYDNDFIYNLDNPPFPNGFNDFIVLTNILTGRKEYVNLNFIFDNLPDTIEDILISYSKKRLKQNDLLKSNSEIPLLTFNSDKNAISDFLEELEVYNDELERDKIRKSLLKKQKNKSLIEEVKSELEEDGSITKNKIKYY